MLEWKQEKMCKQNMNIIKSDYIDTPIICIWDIFNCTNMFDWRLWIWLYPVSVIGIICIYFYFFYNLVHSIFLSFTNNILLLIEKYPHKFWISTVFRRQKQNYTNINSRHLFFNDKALHKHFFHFCFTFRSNMVHSIENHFCQCTLHLLFWPMNRTLQVPCFLRAIRWPMLDKPLDLILYYI